MKLIMMMLSLLLVGTAARAAGGDDILGVWTNEEKDGRIEIFKCGEKYCGKIVWAKEPNYPEGSKEGTPGSPRLDRNNPDQSLRKTPIMGLQIVHNFVFVGDNSWKNGKVYDPKSGRTYSGTLTLVSPTRLDLRGFIGFSFLGRTTVWTR